MWYLLATNRGGDFIKTKQHSWSLQKTIKIFFYLFSYIVAYTIAMAYFLVHHPSTTPMVFQCGNYTLKLSCHLSGIHLYLETSLILYRQRQQMKIKQFVLCPYQITGCSWQKMKQKREKKCPYGIACNPPMDWALYFSFSKNIPGYNDRVLAQYWHDNFGYVWAPADDEGQVINQLI